MQTSGENGMKIPILLQNSKHTLSPKEKRLDHHIQPYFKFQRIKRSLNKRSKAETQNPKQKTHDRKRTTKGPPRNLLFYEENGRAHCYTKKRVTMNLVFSYPLKENI